MILDNWAKDAERLAAALPAGAETTTRIDYLLHNVVPRGIDACMTDTGATVFDKPLKVGYNFAVIDKDSIKPYQFPRHLQYLLAGGNNVAFVMHGSTISMLALASYYPTRPGGNGTTVLHELQHVTEREEGLLVADLHGFPAILQKGRHERRAYGLNISMLELIDGTDFNRYLDGWPHMFEVEGTGDDACAEIFFHDDGLYEPPKETLMHDMWLEGEASLKILQSIGRAAVLEKRAAGLPEVVIDGLAGRLHS